MTDPVSALLAVGLICALALVGGALAHLLGAE